MPESFKPVFWRSATGREPVREWLNELSREDKRTIGRGIAIMARKNPHIGSSFESWLEDAGIREEVTATAIKAVIARQLASEMKKKKITKQRMAELMKTSRAQVDRLLDPDSGSATIESLQRAAKIVGRELRLQLV
jgi:antitoxin HicB